MCLLTIKFTKPPSTPTPFMYHKGGGWRGETDLLCNAPFFISLPFWPHEQLTTNTPRYICRLVFHENIYRHSQRMTGASERLVALKISNKTVDACPIQNASTSHFFSFQKCLRFEESYLCCL